MLRDRGKEADSAWLVLSWSTLPDKSYSPVSVILALFGDFSILLAVQVVL
jgi:hypothetical protein